MSVQNTVLATVMELSQTHEIFYYNTKEYRLDDQNGLTFVAYPDIFNYYTSESLNCNISYFQFSEILVDISVELFDFLDSEVAKRSPQFIIYSHLAFWGKLLSLRYHLPSISLFSTFVLDAKIMLPFFKEAFLRTNNDSEADLAPLKHMAKLKKVLSVYDLHTKVNPWEVYMNKGDLNLVFIIPPFQPNQELFDGSFKFVNYPRFGAPVEHLRDYIYVSMGTVLNNQRQFYKMAVKAFAQINEHVIFSTGSKSILKDIPECPSNVNITNFVNQKEMLPRAKLFVSRGGMASVHEAIYSQTPIIVISGMPEQFITGNRVQELGIGLHLSMTDVTIQSLRESIFNVLEKSDLYIANLKKLNSEIIWPDVVDSPHQLIDKFLGHSFLSLENVSFDN